MVSLSNRSMRPSGGVPPVSGAFVVASIVLSVVSVAALPKTMQNHWSLNAGPYYGPEFAPTVGVLALFPALAATLVVGTSLSWTRLDGTAEFEAMRPHYEWGAVLTLAVVMVVQVLVVWLDLP